jgi:hypothetical protein
MKRYMEIVMLLILGGVAFFLVVGPRVLYPENIAWLGDGDPVQHFLGWQFFRDAAWSFPLGLNPNYGLEVSNGIAYSDSIPLLAISLKLFSSFLPHPFQYFGLWLLACFVLQAWFGWKLTGLVSEIPVIRWLAAGLFVFSPPMLWRLHCHLSLVGHFLILAALYLVFQPAREKKTFYWAVLIAVTTLVHAYLLAMVLLLWLSDILTSSVRKTLSWRGAIQEIVIAVSVLFLVSWQAGYFSAGHSVSGTGYGFFRMNVLSIVDPSRWSYALKDLPEGPGDYEGFNYLGLGVILAAFFALPVLLTRKTDVVVIIKRWFVLVLTLFALTLFAMSNKIGFGSANVVIPLPELVLHLANIFRSSGRMFWPAFYVILLAIIFVIVRGYKKKAAISIMAAALIAQVFDTNAGWSTIRSKMMIKPSSVWATPLQNPFWNSAAMQYKNIRMLMPLTLPLELSKYYLDNWNIFATYASKYNMATDVVWLARISDNALDQARSKAIAMLGSGHYDQDSLYILDELSVYPALKHKVASDLIARVNGFSIVAPGWKQCANCPQDMPELPMDAVLGVSINPDERLEFAAEGKGRQYLYGEWSASKEEGILSSGPEAGLVLPLASRKISSFEIELNATLYRKPPTQRVEFLVNDIVVSSVSLTKPSGNIVLIEIPDEAKDKIEKQGRLDIGMRFPDAINLLRFGFADLRKLAVGLVAVTVH